MAHECTAMTPLPTFPGNLVALDPRDRLLYLNSFMKNTLIRAFNRINELSCLGNRDDEFVQYIVIFCDMAELHLEGDELFFTKKCSNGESLIDMLGPECNANSSELRHFLSQLKLFAPGLRKTEKACCLVSRHLRCFRDLFSRASERQREVIAGDRIKNCDLSASEIEGMIQENINWINERADASVILPFILGHHDVATSAFWPELPGGALAAVPAFVELRSCCWELAPFHPVSRI